jgi:hypothetical protein
VSSHSEVSREQRSKFLGDVSRSGGRCLSWQQARPELPWGACRKHVVFVLRCAWVEGAIQGVEDTVAVERGSGPCSAWLCYLILSFLDQ